MMKPKTVLMIGNQQTGECVSIDVINAQTVKSLRGVIRSWANETNSFGCNSLTYVEGSRELYNYLYEYTRLESYDTCDSCDMLVQRKNMKYHHDNYGVCLFAQCNDCSPC